MRLTFFLNNIYTETDDGSIDKHKSDDWSINEHRESDDGSIDKHTEIDDESIDKYTEAEDGSMEENISEKSSTCHHEATLQFKKLKVFF